MGKIPRRISNAHVRLFFLEKEENKKVYALRSGVQQTTAFVRCGVEETHGHCRNRRDRVHVTWLGTILTSDVGNTHGRIEDGWEDIIRGSLVSCSLACFVKLALHVPEGVQARATRGFFPDGDGDAIGYKMSALFLSLVRRNGGMGNAVDI